MRKSAHCKKSLYLFTKKAPFIFTWCFPPFVARWHFDDRGGAHFGKAGAVCVCGVICVCAACRGVSDAARCGLPSLCYSKKPPLAATQETSDTNQPPRCVVAHRCATPSRPQRHSNRLGDLLHAHALSCHLLDGKNFLCGAGHFARKLLVNTLDVKNMRLWCMDVLSPAWMCVGVQCGKTCCFFTNVISGGHFSSEEAQIEQQHDGFGHPFSIRRFLGKRNLRCQKHKGNGPNMPMPPAHPVRHDFQARILERSQVIRVKYQEFLQFFWHQRLKCRRIISFLQSSACIERVLPRVGDNIICLITRESHECCVHLLQHELQIAHSSHDVRHSRQEFKNVVISLTCSAAHSNIISDSWITPAKNAYASVFFDHC